MSSIFANTLVFRSSQHLIAYPLFVHSKARKKMVGLAAAYRRQLQYEEQQLKTHLTKMNEISFSKKYTTDGKEFFHSRAEVRHTFTTPHV